MKSQCPSGLWKELQVRAGVVGCDSHTHRASVKCLPATEMTWLREELTSAQYCLPR